MYRELRIAVVIPAFNERGKIAATVATVPELVDDILVIDDASRDDTSRQAELAALRRTGPTRVEVIRHAANRGVGGAIITGYRRAMAIGAEGERAVIAGGDRAADPAVRAVAEDLDACRRGAAQRGELGLLRRVVARRVVDDDDVVGQVGDGGDGVGDLAALVEGRNHDGDAELAMHPAGCSRSPERRPPSQLS